MAPKAKAKGLAMAVMRRPAALPAARVMRRRPSRRDPAEDPWEAGEVVPLHSVPLEKLRPGSSLVLTEADYFGATAKAAGVIRWRCPISHPTPG